VIFVSNREFLKFILDFMKFRDPSEGLSIGFLNFSGIAWNPDFFEKMLKFAVGRKGF